MPTEIQISVNGQHEHVASGTSIASFLSQRGLLPKHVAVELNEQVIPRALHDAQELADGDRLEVVTLVGGG